MIFRLSNRQRKELLIRATPLLVVLPAPRDCQENDAGLLKWARHALDEDKQHVTRAYRDDVCVTTPNGHDGLSGVIGQIVQGRADELCWWVDCVLVELDPLSTPRHPRSRPQWPAAAITANKQWPASTLAAGG